MLTLLPLGSFLEYLAIRLKGEKVQDLKARFDWSLRNDDGQAEQQRLTLSNGALSHLAGQHEGRVDAGIVMSRAELATWLATPDGLLQALDTGAMDIRGNKPLFRQLLAALDQFDPMFNVVEP
jgi:alkyl sulfatase BDS1-like metallo-beta-lactamase superfamily hydrolase